MPVQHRTYDWTRESHRWGLLVVARSRACVTYQYEFHSRACVQQGILVPQEHETTLTDCHVDVVLPHAFPQVHTSSCLRHSHDTLNMSHGNGHSTRGCALATQV